jgi:hypothetical protein
MDDENTRRMASSLRTYIGRNSKKLVCRPGTMQRNCRMENIVEEVCGNLLI